MIWRLLFVVAAIGLMVGGSMHPGGSFAEMLADPAWVTGHTLVLGGFLALLAGLALHRRGRRLPERSDRWSRLAILGTALMTVEAVVHTAAVVDAAAVAAGTSAPVFTTHIWFARTLQPAFGILLAGFVWVAARERTLGSPWIAPLGVLGPLAWGFAPILALHVRADFAILFPLSVMVMALWMTLAALWPARSSVPAVRPA
jgi:hypothetical protein